MERKVTVENLIKGFPHNSRARAMTVYKRGLHDMAVQLENLLYDNPGLNDAELIARIGVLIKETKENNS